MKNTGNHGIFFRMHQHEEAANLGEQAYKLSQKLGNKLGMLDSLIAKSHLQYKGKIDVAKSRINKTK